MMFGLYARLAAIAVVVIFLAGTHWKAYRTGKAHVQLEWDADTAQRVAAALAAEQAARAKEQELRDAADKQKEKDRAKIVTLNRAVADALERLHNRPERPIAANVPASAASGASGAGCTGAELYRTDSAFLVRQSERADRLRIALAACQAGYEAGRAVK